MTKEFTHTITRKTLTLTSGDITCKIFYDDRSCSAYHMEISIYREDKKSFSPLQNLYNSHFPDVKRVSIQDLDKLIQDLQCVKDSIEKLDSIFD